MLNHVVVKKGSKFIGQFIGRYAVSMEENFVRLKTVAGQDLPHELLADVLQAVDIDCLARASKLHEQRKHPWRVRYRQGLSGCEDFWVEYLFNPELKIIGKGGRLHISMAGKLNQGLALPLMDLAPIMSHPDFPTRWEKEHKYSFEVICENNLPRLEDFNTPGSNVYGEEEDIPVDEIIEEEV